MTTYADMQNRIADEIGPRTDLTSEIQLAIQTAIQKYERRKFYFNELYNQAAFYTVLGQEFYTGTDWSYIPNLVNIKKIWVTVSSNRYTLEPRTSQYLADVSVNPQVTGWPIEYSYFAEQLRFYMIPNGVYPIGVEATIRQSTLVNPTDTNPWMVDAEPLIRSEAKRVLYLDVIKDTDQANTMQSQVAGYLSDLVSENSRRIATPRLRPTYF